MGRSDHFSANKVVAWHLLSYLCANPEAKDTADGIEDWWLRGCVIDVDQTSVKEALNYLVTRDWLTVRGNSSGCCIYGLNQTRKTELQWIFRSSK